jgi:uncharacterized protein (DUF1778 family)
MNIRVTDDELESIRSKAGSARLSVTEFVVRRLCDGRETSGTSMTSDYGDGCNASRRRAYAPDASGNDPGRIEDIHVRCTSDERRRIVSLADQADLSITDYVIRRATDEQRTSATGDTSNLAGILEELCHQGRALDRISEDIGRIAGIAWRDDVNGPAIDRLVREVTEDNATARTGLDRATRELVHVLGERHGS